RASARSERRSAKKADEYSSGGRKTSRTRSGFSWMSGIPGTSPRTRPPMTSGIGYGMFSQFASALSPAAETKSAALTVCRSLTGRIVPRRDRVLWLEQRCARSVGRQVAQRGLGARLDQRGAQGRGVAVEALAGVGTGSVAGDQEGPVAALQRQQLADRAL